MNHPYTTSQSSLPLCHISQRPGRWTRGDERGVLGSKISNSEGVSPNTVKGCDKRVFVRDTQRLISTNKGI